MILPPKAWKADTMEFRVLPCAMYLLRSSLSTYAFLSSEKLSSELFLSNTGVQSSHRTPKLSVSREEIFQLSWKYGVISFLRMFTQDRPNVVLKLATPSIRLVKPSPVCGTAKGLAAVDVLSYSDVAMVLRSTETFLLVFLVTASYRA